MNLKDRMIVEEYRKSREDFIQLGNIVRQKLADIASERNIVPLAIEHRVKQEESLIGKLYRKGDRYSSLEDLTDILGARIICFFSDEVDAVGKAVEEFFVIDWEIPATSARSSAPIRSDTSPCITYAPCPRTWDIPSSCATRNLKYRSAPDFSTFGRS